MPVRNPHRFICDQPVHIIYRLAGSIPSNTLAKISSNFHQRLSKIEIKHGVKWAQDQNVSKIFEVECVEATLDYEYHYQTVLEQIKQGPRWLSDPNCAKLVSESLHFLSAKMEVTLLCYCIMSNHVHLLIQSATSHFIPIGNFMRPHKRHTARAINKLIGKTGTSFWATDYFDRDVRQGSFHNVLDYILQNPVKAGLVDHWRDWPHTYVAPHLEEALK